MNTMSYKGYTAKIEFDPDDNIFFGNIIGIRDTVGFHGESVTELKKAFGEAVDFIWRVVQRRDGNRTSHAQESFLSGLILNFIAG